jgi:predicted phosphodiesterase
MKIALYSDLHLESSPGWMLPGGLEADILILAGDIIVFNDFTPIQALLGSWDKPVIYVPGNHEYHTQRPMSEHNLMVKAWLAENLPQVHFLLNEGASLGGVHFFGGTMWTDFQGANPEAMFRAPISLSDFDLIFFKTDRLTPLDTIRLHHEFKKALKAWFGEDLVGPRVVVTHHAPLEKPRTQHSGGILQPAFVCFDMAGIIDKYQPAAWIYGHTHESDDRAIGRTRLISNPLGYFDATFENYGGSGYFDENGCGLAL